MEYSLVLCKSKWHNCIKSNLQYILTILMSRPIIHCWSNAHLIMKSTILTRGWWQKQEPWTFNYLVGYKNLPNRFCTVTRAINYNIYWMKKVLHYKITLYPKLLTSRASIITIFFLYNITNCRTHSFSNYVYLICLNGLTHYGNVIRARRLQNFVNILRRGETVLSQNNPNLTGFLYFYSSLSHF